MADITSTTSAAIIEKVVSSIVQETLIQKSILIPSIMDVSSMIRPGMDRLDIPRFTALAVQTVTEGSEVTPATPTIAVDQLDMDQNEAITWAITDRSSVQSKVDQVAQLVKDGARSLAAVIDDCIMTELVAASAAAPDHRLQMTGTGNIELTIADITNARSLLLRQDLMFDGNMFLVVPPEQEKVLLNIDNFISADRYGSSDPVMNGEIGRVFGFRVLVSTSASLATDEAVFYHRSAVAYGTQQSAKFETERRVTFLKDDYSLSQLYGCQLLDLGVRQVLYNNDGL